MKNPIQNHQIENIHLNIPQSHWIDLKNKDSKQICRWAQCDLSKDGGFILPFFNDLLWVDIHNNMIKQKVDGDWQTSEDTLLTLMTLVYLLSAKETLLTGTLMGIKDLKDAHFFRGPHELETAPLLNRFGNRTSEFEEVAKKMGGKPLPHGDMGITLYPFPKIPLHYVLWKGDDMFGASLTVLFDRSIENHFSADAIYGTVNYTSTKLFNTNVSIKNQ